MAASMGVPTNPDREGGDAVTQRESYKPSGRGSGGLTAWFLTFSFGPFTSSRSKLRGTFHSLFATPG